MMKKLSYNNWLTNQYLTSYL